MATMTKTTMETYLAEIWSQVGSITYRSNVVLPNLMDRRWEPEAGVGKGDTVNIPNFTQNAVTDVTARSTFGTAATLTPVGNTETQTQLLINKMGTIGYAIPVEMSVQALPNYDRLLAEGIGTALALYVDNQLAADDSNGLDALTALGTDNVDVTEDILLQAEVVLDNNNAPLTDRFLVVSPATRASLLKIEAFRNSLYGSIGKIDASAGRGYIGHGYTYSLYVSNNLEGGTSGKKNALFQRECIAFVEQKGVTIVRDLNIEDGLINQTYGYIVFGHKLVKSTYGREIDGK